MRAWPAPRIALPVAAALAVQFGAGSIEAAAPRPALRVGTSASEQLPPEVFAATLKAPGEVVRRSGAATVESVQVPPRLRVGGEEFPRRLWRVTVRGRFPPRALRYSVLAGGRFVGYGVPGGDEGAVRTVTGNPSVLAGRITTRYGDAPSRLGGTGGPALAPAAAARMPDPSEPGPYQVTRTVYDFGDEVFQPTDFGRKVELTADVHYPTGLPDGPYPLVLFMHGNHSSCYRRHSTRYQWPCPEGWRPLPNYIGYDYIGKRLATHGFVVVSVSANGVNVLGNRVANAGMRQRGEVLEKHIDLWRKWSTRGGRPFGTTFVGKVDLSRIGTMGHSRGGEGVVWHKIVDDRREDPYGVDAVLALAPVDFTRKKINEASFAVVLPYCDGDVSDLQGVHFFDDSRYAVPGDPSAKHTVTAFGANHNFFNTVWTPGGGFPGAFDDGEWTRCEERLTAPQERDVGRAYIVGFFRRYLIDEVELDPMWTGAATPPGIDPARTLTSFLAPDLPTHRMDVARFTDARDLITGQSGGAVTPSRLSLYGWCADTWQSPCVPGPLSWSDIHLPGLPQAMIGWSNYDGVVRFEIPDDKGDVRGFAAFQFRAVVNPAYDANGRYRFQDLVVALIDANGDSAEVLASEVGNEALAYPLTGRHRRRGHVILNQVRFPLRRFRGINLGDVDAVELRFSRTRAGVLNVADVAFSRGGS